MLWDDESPERVVVQTEQVLDEILDGIARDREIMPHGVNKLLARIPITIYERSVHEGWGDDDWAKWLNSAEAAPFRVWSGRV
jgi:hypothetical protein